GSTIFQSHMSPSTALSCSSLLRRPPSSTLFPYTTLFRSRRPTPRSGPARTTELTDRSAHLRGFCPPRTLYEHPLNAGLGEQLGENTCAGPVIASSRRRGWRRSPPCPCRGHWPRQRRHPSNRSPRRTST